MNKSSSDGDVDNDKGDDECDEEDDDDDDDDGGSMTMTWPGWDSNPHSDNTRT